MTVLSDLVDCIKYFHESPTLLPKSVNVVRSKLPEACHQKYDIIMKMLGPEDQNMIAEALGIISNMYDANNNGKGVIRPIGLVYFICKTVADVRAKSQFKFDYDVTLQKVLIGAMLYNTLQDLSNVPIQTLLADFEKNEKFSWKIFDQDIIKIPRILETDPQTGLRYPRQSFNELRFDEVLNNTFLAVFVASVVNDMVQKYATYERIWLVTMVQNLCKGKDLKWQPLFDKFVEDLNALSS